MKVPLTQDAHAPALLPDDRPYGCMLNRSVADKNLLLILQRVCAERAEPWALATLVRTRGSTYRKPGARLLVDSRGGTLGVLSGGCLEEEIARHGVNVIKKGVPQLVVFDTRRLYGCNGFIEILIEKVPTADTADNFLTLLANKLSRRESCRVRTRFEGQNLGSELVSSDALVIEEPETLLHTILPPVHLLLFGNGPEIEPIQVLASGLKWTVDHLPHPSTLTDNFVSDDQTAALVMTHNFGRDLATLDRLLPLRLPYLGLLGPKKRHAELLAQLQEYRALDPSWMEHLYAPAGLDIGSEAPEEIALSIVSEVSAVLSKRRGGFLRDRLRAIHSDQSQIIGHAA
jgi:xanthine dehydrogenase accessory factor